MPSTPSLRIALAAACVLTALGVFAGTSAGSGSSPRASALRLLAHDTSSFGSLGRRTTKPGPQLLNAPRKKPAGKTPLKIYYDRALTNTSVLNPSSDMGKTQLLVAQNGRYSVYSRTWVASGGATLASVSSVNFWAGLSGPDAVGLCATHPQGEPTVAYDWAADRWVISEAAYLLDGASKPTGAYVQCVAVSTSSDATGTWNRYVYQVSTTVYPEHPALGVWSDGYYLSFDQHTAGDTWAGAGALALERSKMLIGAAAQARYYDLEDVTPGLGGMLPANITGTTAPAANAPELFLQAHDDPDNVHDRLELWGFHVDWTVPSSATSTQFQPVDNIPLNTGGWTYASTFSCPQPGGSSNWSACLVGQAASGPALPLEPLATVFSDADDALPQLGGRLQWRSLGGTETLAATTTQTVGSGEAAPAWFTLSKVGAPLHWGLASRGIYHPDSSSRFLPSVAFDNAGQVGLAFVRTDGAHFLTTAYTDPAAASPVDVDIDGGTTPFTAGRTFGGGTQLSLDPINLCTFWFVGPTPLNGGLTASIDNFSLSGCTASATQPPVLTGDPTLFAPLIREGLTITGTPATFSAVTSSTTYQWRRCDVRGLNCINIPGANATTYLMTAADAVGDRTLRFQETDTNGNGTVTAVSHDTTIVQSIPPVNDVRPAISGTAQAGQVLTTSKGTWTSSSPLSYTYRWRRCASGVCANISGANASTYTATAADIGSTVDVIVSATNTGGGTDANAVETPTVAAAPVSSGGGSSGGGGGGGGGGPGSPDLAVTGTASNLTPAVGDSVTFFVTVTDKNAKPAQQLYLTVALGSGLQFVSSTSDRGNPCALSAGQIKCFLDWLSGDVLAAHLQITTKVIAATDQTFSGTASAGQGELNPADNTLSLTLNATPAPTITTSGVPGGGTTTATPDKTKPAARALLTPAKRGTVAKLRFKISDNKGVAKAITTVKRGTTVVGTASTGFGPVVSGSVYYVGWHVPAKAAKGTYSFCVTAVDRAGNKSARSCAPLALK